MYSKRIKSKLIQGIILVTMAIACGLSANARQKADSLYLQPLLDSAYQLEGTNPKKALICYRYIYDWSSERQYLPGMAQALHYSGIVLAASGKYDSAISNYHQAAALYLRSKDYWSAGASYNNAGNAYQYFNSYDSALVNYQRALDIFDKFNLPDGSAHVHLDLGRVFQVLKQYPKAMHHYESAEAGGIKQKDSVLFAQALINQGTVLAETGKQAENLQKQLQAFAIGKKISNNYLLEVTSINISDYYTNLKELNTALQYALQALHYAGKVGRQYDIAKIKRVVGKLLMENKAYAQAEQYLSESLSMAREANSTETIAETYQALQQLYSLKGDYKTAYQYQSLARQLTDSIFGEKQVRTINELEVKYQALKKDKMVSQQELELASKDVSLQKQDKLIIIIIAGLLIMMILMLLIVILFLHKKKLAAQKLLTLQKEHEVRLLEQSIQGEEKERTRIARELHDGVSGMLAAAKMQLSVVQASGNIAAHTTAMELIDDAAAEVRKTAHNLLPELLLQFGLDEALRRYFQTISVPDKTFVEYHSLGNIGGLHASFALSVYRIAQELVHNALKHAKASEIFVQLSQTDSLLTLTVEDDGVGFDLTAGEGAGLANIRNRVQVVNGSITWNSSAGNGTSVYAEFETISLS